jgi:tripartite-type tricarboxylate transporter receptor subunit TctC
MAIETSGAATPLVKAGSVRALAVSPGKRSALFPDLPTLAESGLKGYDVSTWYGFLVPKGTPEPIRTKLYDTTVEILKSPEIIKKLADFGAEPGGEPPAQFTAFIKEETDKWVGLAKKAGISAE